MENYKEQVIRSKGDNSCKIRVRKQRTDVGKNSFVNRTTEPWNQLTTDVLEIVPYKTHSFREKVRKVILSECAEVSNCLLYLSVFLIIVVF